MRYIIIPKFDEVAETLAAKSDRLDEKSRSENFQELSQRRRSSIQGRRTRAGAPVDFEITAKEVAGPGSDVRVIAAPEAETIATGVTIIETDPDGAAALNNEFADVDVIADEELELIEPDRQAAAVAADTSDLTDSELWHLKAIGLEAARSNGFKGTGEGVTVAVLDTGIADVPEIHGKVTQTLELDTTNWVAKTDPAPKDTEGHGTHVAGLIAGDVVGVAPGARMANVIMIPDGRGTLSNYILALEWVASQPQIALLNMSAGKRGFFPNMRIMARVIRRVRALSAIAIGNEGLNSSRSPGNYPEVFSVGASNSDNEIWRGSGGGELTIDQMNVTVPKLVAPGEGVTSCVMHGGYQSWNGTSMATPILTGIACLMLERFPDISLADLENELLSNCEDLNLDAKRQGRGLVQLPVSLSNAVG